jgi:hypothetical protein
MRNQCIRRKEPLIETKPTTLAGALALIPYVNGYCREPNERRALLEDDELLVEVFPA